MATMIPLSDAAQRLSISWERAWRALLNGRLEGEKQNGRWQVSTVSVRRFQRERERDRMGDD